MTFLILAAVLSAAASLFFFRKGGIYNPIDPVEDMPSLDRITEIKLVPPPTPTPPETPPTEANKPTVADFCRAIELFEGKPGDANYRNNNPGNVRFNYAGYLPIYGNVRCSPAGFAIFPTFELGRLYLQNMVRNMIKNHPGEDILAFMTRYAPPFENPTQKYAEFIANRLGVDIHYPMKNLV